MIPIIDMHCDTISELYKLRYNDTALQEGSSKEIDKTEASAGAGVKDAGKGDSLRSSRLMIDLKRMKDAGYMCQSFALFLHLGRLSKEGKSPFAYAMELSDLFDEEMEKNRDLIRPVTTGTEIEVNFSRGLMSALKTIEEGGAYEGSIEKLEELYKIGVRKSTLTWNFENELAFPNRSVFNKEKGTCSCTGLDTENGLKKKGFEFVEAMESMGMLIDISHLNDAGIWDVFKTVRKSTPVIASHSNARACCMHPRNLSDEMMREIAGHGGLFGLNFCPSFLSKEQRDGREESRIRDMIVQLKYMRDVAGIDFIGLGSDFDGIEGELELSGAQDMQKLADAMSLSGFSDEEIEKVFYKNALRVYKEVLG